MSRKKTATETSTETPVRDFLTTQTKPDSNFSSAANDYISKRAIDNEVAEARGYRFLTQGEIHTDDDAFLRSVGVPDKYFEQGGTAIQMPLWALSGTRANLSQIRVESPEMTSSESRFKTPSGAKRGDSFGNLPADVNPIESNRDAVLNVNLPLLITEGAAKADSMVSALRREGKGTQAAGVVSFTGVSLATEIGANGRQDRLSPRTIGSDEWAPLLAGRDVVIAYDGDFTANQQVAESLRRLATCLTRDADALRVRIIDLSSVDQEPLPERLHHKSFGVDDYLAGAEEVGKIARPMSALLRSAGQWATVEKKLVKAKTLRPAATPQALGEASLTDALHTWVGEAPDEIQDEITWARDDAGNAFVRALNEEARDWLGGWKLSIPQALCRFITDEDRDEANRLAGALTDRPRDEVAELLGLDYDAIVTTLGLAPSNELTLVEQSLREAIQSVRDGGVGKSIVLHVEHRGGAQATLTAEISKSPAQHGLFETIVIDPERPPIRNHVLPYVLAKWSLRSFSEVLPDLTLRALGTETRFVGAAILPGGVVATYDGLDQTTDDDPKSLIRGLKGQGTIIREPIGIQEEMAARRSLSTVGVEERTHALRTSRMGWMQLPDRTHAWVGTYSAVTALGITRDVLAQRGPDETSNRELRGYERSIGFDEVASPDELLRWPEFLSEVLDLAPDAVSIPVFGQFFRSFLPQETGTRTATVAVVAPPGAMKSALISRCGFLMSTAREGSVKNVAIDRDTAASVANASPFFAHQILIGDDYRPSKDRDDEKRQGAVVDAIVSGAYDGDSARKALSNGANRAHAEFLGSPITSAETTFGTKTSRLERQLTVRIERGDVIPDALDEFNSRWVRTGVGRRLVASYLQGIARALDADPENPTVGVVELRQLEGLYRSRFGFGSDRPALAAVQVLSGLGLFVEVMAEEVDAVLGENAPDLRDVDSDNRYITGVRGHFDDLLSTDGPAKGILRSLARAQYGEHEQAGAGMKIIDLISDGIESGAYHLTGADGGIPAGAERLGWTIHVDAYGKRTFVPRHGSVALGRVGVGGEIALLLVGPLDKVRESVGERLTKGDLKTRLSEFLSDGYDGRGGEKISGLTVTDQGKSYPMRGFPVDLVTLGIDRIGDDDSSTPVQPARKGVKDEPVDN